MIERLNKSQKERKLQVFSYKLSKNQFKNLYKMVLVIKKITETSKKKKSERKKKKKNDESI